MNCCVLAKIAKRSISFWYQSDGNAYAPLTIRESNEIPLYFYVNGNDFLFGSVARERFNRHDPNAYGNYFELIKDPGKHFSIYGNKKPVKQLFYYGVEQYLSHFLNTILYKVDSIESYRQQFPLRFLFDVDIEDNEQTLIISLFQEAGYFNLDRVRFDEILFRLLAQKGSLPPNKAVLLLSGVDDVLYFKLHKNLNASPVGNYRLAGQGADPRVKILAELIIAYILLQHSYLSIDKETEIAVLLPFCASLLENINAVITGDATLSDGSKYWFKVNERNLNDRLLYYANDSMIYTGIDELLKVNALAAENVVILLGTEEISTPYFLNKLLKKYPYVKEVSAADAKDAMQGIFAAIAASNYKVASQAPTAPPVLPKAPLPAPKLPPPLPPKRQDGTNNIPVALPQLPAARPSNTGTATPPKLPPLPPKKNT